jgi:hypothetical protein
MTNEEVNEIENKLRQAQKLVEEAGQIVCSAHGKYAPEIWSNLTKAAGEIGELIHPLWKLRPEE